MSDFVNPHEKACMECDTSQICLLKPDETLKQLNRECDNQRRRNVWMFYEQARQEIDTIAAQALYMKVIIDQIKPKIEVCLQDRTKNEEAIKEVNGLINCHYLIFQANNNALGPLTAGSGRHEESSTLQKIIRWIREQG